MKTVVLGSINIDRTYSVEHFVQSGETIQAERMELFCGGKGFNQAVALSRAGMEVYFAGALGEDGGMLERALEKENIRTDYLLHTEGPTGHAVIQNDAAGQNCIIILAGANGKISCDDIDRILEHFAAGDLIVLQNEISNVDHAIRKAHEKGLRIAFNPSPYQERIRGYELALVDYLFVNEVEGAALSEQKNNRDILLTLHKMYPKTNVILTMGSEGSATIDPEGTITECGVYQVQTVDTTAAGDTFTGYYLCGTVHGSEEKEALRTAAVASGIAVSKRGAFPSVPRFELVETAMKTMTEENWKECRL